MKSEQAHAGDLADSLIRTEVQVQDKMWGDANDRADTTKGQLLAAAHAQVDAIRMIRHLAYGRETAFTISRHQNYPKDWNGFRDYGSDVANLVVAAAYLRNEIKRMITDGESITRSKRTEPYAGPDIPAVSSDVARTGVCG